MNILTLLVAGAFFALAANPATISASLQPPGERKAAPVFKLLDGSGKQVQLADYRGKVVLLNFWATDCGGCRIEIPWFVELDQAFRTKNVAVVGISLDLSYESLKNANEGWSRVKPFVQAQGIRYSILMGDEASGKLYQEDALPATYLIDAKGRIAAKYVGLINKENVSANINALLGEH